MKLLLFLFNFMITVYTVHAMRRPLSRISGQRQDRIEQSPSSPSSSAASMSLEHYQLQATEPSSTPNGSESIADLQPKRSRKWKERIVAEKRLMTETLPKLERWIQEAKDNRLGKSNEEVKLGRYGKPLKIPGGMLQLKKTLNKELSNARRFKDPLFDNYINRVEELRRQLPIISTPRLPIEEARARKKASMERSETRKKVKALGVNVKPSYLHIGRRRGYKEGEPGYEKYLEDVRKENEKRRIKRLEAKQMGTGKEVGELAGPGDDDFTPVQPQVKGREVLPTWSSKRQRTGRLQ